VNTAPLRHLPAADEIKFGYTEAMCGRVITDNSMICVDPTTATCSRCVEINIAAGVVTPPTGWPLAERDWYTRARIRIVRETTVNSTAFCVRRTCGVGEELTMYQAGRAGWQVDRGTWQISIDDERVIAVPAGCAEVIEVLEERPPTWEAAALTAEQVTALLATHHPGAAEAARAWAAAGLHVAREFAELVIRTPGPQYRRIGCIGIDLRRQRFNFEDFNDDHDRFSEPYQAIIQDSEYKYSRRTLRLDALPIDPVAAADDNAGQHREHD
jgi:hypothetical protein